MTRRLVKTPAPKRPELDAAQLANAKAQDDHLERARQDRVNDLFRVYGHHLSDIEEIERECRYEGDAAHMMIARLAESVRAALEKLVP